MALSLSSQASLPTTAAALPATSSTWTSLTRSETSFDPSSFEFDPSSYPETYLSEYFPPATDTPLTTSTTPSTTIPSIEPTCDAACQEEQRRQDEEHYNQKLKDYNRRTGTAYALVIGLPIGIVFLLVFCCVGICCCRGRSRSRSRSRSKEVGCCGRVGWVERDERKRGMAEETQEEGRVSGMRDGAREGQGAGQGMGGLTGEEEIPEVEIGQGVNLNLKGEERTGAKGDGVSVGSVGGETLVEGHGAGGKPQRGNANGELGV